MRKNILPYLLFILCLVSCIKENQTAAELSVGDRIPDFSVTMNDGRVVTGEELSQGVSCIVFFTTACPDCRRTLPEVQEVYDEYNAKGVSFVIVSRSEGAESIRAYWAEHGFTMPYSAQNDAEVYELFAKTRVPRIYICREGLIRSIFTDTPLPTAKDLSDSLKKSAKL